MPRKPMASGQLPNKPLPSVDDLIFDVYAEPNDTISVLKFIKELKVSGLKKQDPRLRSSIANFKQFESKNYDEPFNIFLRRDTFKRCIANDLPLIGRAIKNHLVIPDWQEFKCQIEEIFYKCKFITEGEVSSYNPQLKRFSPDSWGLSICSIDGQRASWGDHKVPFSFMSGNRALNYAIVLDTLGGEEVHKYVGQEPSGRVAKEICLDYNQKPHNPMINAGAIIISSLIGLNKDMSMADRFDFVMEMYRKLCGNGFVEFNNPVFLSEKENADRNFALSYFMREHNCFPEGTVLKDTLDTYFQLQSVEVTCQSAAVMAATLANGGVCPITGETVLNSRSIRDTLAVMYSCGMNEFSGQFAFRVGLPAKCSASGLLMLVIPNVMGVAMWSPPVGPSGCCYRGIKFCEELVQKFSVHNYDMMMPSHLKVDPTRRKIEQDGDEITQVLFSAQHADVGALERLGAKGLNMAVADYDKRTALHIAASEGHADVIKLLLEKYQLDPFEKDRWGRMPIDDAKDFGNPACLQVIQKYLRENRDKFTADQLKEIPSSNDIVTADDSD